jgi:hypothetical protein
LTIGEQLEQLTKLPNEAACFRLVVDTLKRFRLFKENGLNTVPADMDLSLRTVLSSGTAPLPSPIPIGLRRNGLSGGLLALHGGGSSTGISVIGECTGLELAHPAQWDLSKKHQLDPPPSLQSSYALPQTFIDFVLMVVPCIKAEQLLFMYQDSYAVKSAAGGSVKEIAFVPAFSNAAATLANDAGFHPRRCACAAEYRTASGRAGDAATDTPVATSPFYGCEVAFSAPNEHGTTSKRSWYLDRIFHFDGRCYPVEFLNCAAAGIVVLLVVLLLLNAAAVWLRQKTQRRLTL